MHKKTNTRWPILIPSFFLLIFSVSFSAESGGGAAAHPAPASSAVATEDAARAAPVLPTNEESPALASWREALEAARENLPDALAVLCDALEVPDAGRLPEPDEFPEGSLERQLGGLARLVMEARTYARTVLGNPEYENSQFIAIASRAGKEAEPQRELVCEAATLIADAAEEAEWLLDIRDELYERYQAEASRGGARPGTRLAWNLLRIASAGPETRLKPDDFDYTAYRAEITFYYRGVPMHASMSERQLDKQVVFDAYGYGFTADWTPLLQRPVGWMAALAADMRRAGIDSEIHPEWKVLEGPGAPLALAVDEAGKAVGAAFFEGRLVSVETLPEPVDASGRIDEFFAAAEALHNGVMANESISRQLRQALHPVLLGTYQPADPRDYFDSAFCRRLIEADYLEAFVDPLPPGRRAELSRYRETLARVEAGYDAFSINMPDGVRMVAVVGADAVFPSESIRRSSDQVAAAAKAARYEWRVESEDGTVFYSPLPERGKYALMLAERYAGRLTAKPPGVPDQTGVCHPLVGVLASYRRGDERARGSEELWRQAIALDAGRGFGDDDERLGWDFPLHVLYRDDQGDPVLMATLRGVLPSPDFGAIPEEKARRQSEDFWLDAAAKQLSTPGELALIFTYFFHYCSDSPLPEMPNLIGSHYGLSDTHQTVYQTLERRWVGRLIGDCDDVAEFYQVLTARQGKLSYVMNLPAHAAAGYAERLDDGGYEFIVLQTGPVLRFTATSLAEVVEKAYKYFDMEGGESQFTAAAVPLLLRFADEETRTAFVLSARIFGDADYAEKMIRVQEYWHKHVFSAAIEEMERMLETDRELGSIKELGSLYERVGLYEESAALRSEELRAAEGDIQAVISCLLDTAGMYRKAKNRPAALEALGQIEDLLNDLLARGDAENFSRLLSFRFYWALLLSRLGEPERAWEMLRHDVETAREQYGGITEPILRILISLYGDAARKRETGGDGLDALAALFSSLGGTGCLERMGKEIETALGRGFFKSDDSYNAIISRYALMGRYAVAKEGRAAGFALLMQDGPYPTAARNQTLRTPGISETDWKWFRIVPRLYLSYAVEMLDRDEKPELYDPITARTMLELVPRAVRRGTGLGSDISGSADQIKSRLILSFMDRDPDAFNQAMAEVRQRDFSSLYDDSALVFGAYCGLVPLEEFPAWIDAFHQFFPGRQHYFKVVYGALDKEYFEHAALLAKATARFFPNDQLLVREAKYVEELIPKLKSRNQSTPDSHPEL